ncbi:TPA: lipoprotein, partial [Escherichia coli]
MKRFFLLFFLSGCTVGDYVRPLLPGNIS